MVTTGSIVTTHQKYKMFRTVQKFWLRCEETIILQSIRPIIDFSWSLRYILCNDTPECRRRFCFLQEIWLVTKCIKNHICSQNEWFWPSRRCFPLLFTFWSYEMTFYNFTAALNRCIVHFQSSKMWLHGCWTQNTHSTVVSPALFQQFQFILSISCVSFALRRFLTRGRATTASVDIKTKIRSHWGGNACWSMATAANMTMGMLQTLFMLHDIDCLFMIAFTVLFQHLFGGSEACFACLLHVVYLCWLYAFWIALPTLHCILIIDWMSIVAD